MKAEKAIQEVADRQVISMSAAIKQAIEKYFQQDGVEWRGMKIASSEA